MEQYPDYHRNALERAAGAGDFGATEAIAGKYWETKGDFKGKDLDTDPVFQQYSKRLYEATEGKPFEGADEKAGQYGLDVLRGLEWNDISLAKQLTRWGAGDISDEERNALRVMSQGYEKSGGSLEGVGAAIKNILLSPSTYVGLGVGSLVTKGGSKLAGKALIKNLVKGAGTDAGKAAGKAAGADLAAKGAQTAGQRATRGAAAGAAEGSLYSAAFDAGQQSFQSEDGEYDIGRGLGAAGVGAAAGGILGGILAPLVTKDRTAIKQAREVVAGADAVPSGVSTRIMEEVVSGAPDPIKKRAESGDLSGAYFDYVESAGPLKPEDLLSVFQNAGNKALRQFSTLLDETKKIGKEYGIGDKLVREAVDARRAAKKEGVNPSAIGADITSHPDWANVPQDVQRRILDNLDLMQVALKDASDITDFANKTFGKPNAVEKVLEMPEVNVAANIAPGGYVLTRGAARGLRALRSNKIPGRFADDMQAASKVTPEAAAKVGPRLGSEVDSIVAGRELPGAVAKQADEASLNLDRKVWAPRAAEARVLQEGRNTLRSAKATLGSQSRYGGPQGEWAGQLGVTPEKAKEALQEALQEPSVPKELREKGKRWLQFYDANIPTTKGYVTGSQRTEEALYYQLQEMARTQLENSYKGNPTKELQDLNRAIKYMENGKKVRSGASDRFRENVHSYLVGLEARRDEIKAARRANTKIKAAESADAQRVAEAKLMARAEALRKR